MRKDRHPSVIFLCILLILFHLACNLPTSLIKITPTIEIATVTPSPENCFWNWAYGEGSAAFDTAVMEQLGMDGIQGTVTSSSYGEVYSCDNSFHAKDLDVKLNIQVASIADQSTLVGLADQIYALLQEKLPISNISGLGNVNLTFVSEDGSSTCYWDYSMNSCH